ncbi:MAG TPA: hypothetical protein PKJ16_19355 [Spirochaetota bacterium]|nr:hypothetical protein [Spirochaetota bacterium]HOS38901.1 hypothetical protein [Spirochaetota bacterium]HPU88220.1 hypothetical protein [Spirochaetota bacterium]
MNIKEVTMKFSESDVLRILAIALDDDEGDTLRLVQDTLAPYIKKSLEPH